MEATNAHSHHTRVIPIAKQFTPPRKRAVKQIFEPQISSNCTETLLREYKTLVELLAHLDVATFQKMNTEVNVVIDQLKQWFHQSSSNNTLEIYWAMRHLRQKIRICIQQTKKKPVRFRNKLFTVR